MKNQFIWKINRLRMMGTKEIVWRARQALRIKIEACKLGRTARPPKPNSATGRPWIVDFPRHLDSALYASAADQALNGRWNVFSLSGSELGFPPRWNRDPKTGIEAPLVFGKTLDYRNEHVVGDIKYLWEINRHLQLTTLAQAYQLTGDIRYANGVRSLLESWFEQCPYPKGVNWTSSLELAIRLVNWSFTWQLLGAESSLLFSSDDGRRFKRRWLDSIYLHSDFIAGYLSRYSSANNHLFGELTGLFIAATTWPCWPESARWRQLACDELEVEAVKQNAPDGVNREQAVYYQHEVADMMIACWLVGRANGMEFSEAFTSRLESMLDFIASIMDVSGNVPMIGDSDDALLVNWSQGQRLNVYRSLLATGAVLFDRPYFKFKAGHFDQKSYWLLGDAGRLKFEAMSAPDEKPLLRQEFPEGGYFIIGRNFDSADEIRVVIDAGPLGYLSIAAHGHADALSFTLSAAGHSLLVDPGTYAYHTQKNWRDYFRGTSAHNTVRVDGLDQAEPGGNFMWLGKANAQCEAWQCNDDKHTFIGSHDGYTRLADPVIHRRKIEFFKHKGIVAVEDVFECAMEHEIEIIWHFDEACELLVDERKVLVSVANVSMEMASSESHLYPELQVGSYNPVFGWISRRYDAKIASPTIIWREKITGLTRRITTFNIAVKL